MLRIGEREVHPQTGAVRGGDSGASLTEMELALLLYLVDRADTVVSREELYREVWGYASSVRSRAADVAITRLRAKLEPEPGSPRFFLTERGRGYRFVTPPSHGRGVWVGRTGLLSELRSRRDENLAVVGLGGAGKSSLVRRALHPFAPPWVSLSGDRQPRSALALALGLSSDSQRALGLALSQQPGPIVLDGVEHHLDQVHALVDGFPSTVWWMTSRLPVPGIANLSVPPLLSGAAEELFRELARLSRRGVPLGAEELALVPRLVADLDHNALAIELAGGRAGLLGVEDLLARLHDPAVLASAHTSMDKVLRTTLDLLPEPARGALGVLAHFSAPVEPALAEAASGGLMNLAVLVEAGLVRRAGEGALWVPELVRQAVLRQAGTETTVRFASALAEIGDDAIACLLSPDRALRARRRLAPRVQDLERALQGALDRSEASLAARLAIGLHFCLRSVGQVIDPSRLEAAAGLEPPPELGAWLWTCLAVARESHRLDPRPALERAEGLAEEVGSLTVKALVCGIRAVAAVRHVSDDEARRLEQAKAAAEVVGVAWLRGSALSTLGMWHRRHARWDEAQEAYAEAAHLFRTSGHAVDEAIVLASRSVLDTASAKLDAALHHAERAASIHRRLENRLGEAFAEQSLAVAAMIAGDYERASAAFEISRAGFAASGAVASYHYVRAGQGELWFRRGRRREAHDVFEEAYLVAHELGWTELEAVALGGMAMIDALDDRQQPLAQLEQAAEKLFAAGARSERLVVLARRAYVLGERGDPQGLAQAAEVREADPQVALSYARWYLDQID